MRGAQAGLIVALLAAGVGPLAQPARTAQITTLLGTPVFAKSDTDGSIAKADAALAADPRNVTLILAAARARDVAWQFTQSIDVYTKGLAIAPDDVRLLRFRGHRYISTRHYDRAVTDLARAATIAPSSFDVLYHLGLAHYLRGDFDEAARTYQRCLDTTTDPGPLPTGWRSCATVRTQDNDRVAIGDWLYRALRRAGRDAAAKALLATFGDGLTVGENEAYYTTIRFYQGVVSEAQLLDGSGSARENRLSTVGYGLANFHLANGNVRRACDVMREMVSASNWNAFGFIAAETDLARKGSPCGIP